MQMEIITRSAASDCVAAFVANHTRDALERRHKV